MALRKSVLVYSCPGHVCDLTQRCLSIFSLPPLRSATNEKDAITMICQDSVAALVIDGDMQQLPAELLRLARRQSLPVLSISILSLP